MKIGTPQLIIGVLAIAAIAVYFLYLRNGDSPLKPKDQDPLKPKDQDPWEPGKVPDGQGWREEGESSNPIEGKNVPGWWGGFGQEVRTIGQLAGLFDPKTGDPGEFYDDYHRRILGYLKGYNVAATLANIRHLRKQIAAYLQAGGYHDATAIKPGRFYQQDILA